ISFEDVSSVLAGGQGSDGDTVIAASNTMVTLKGLSNQFQLETSGINFEEVEVAEATDGWVEGSDDADWIEVIADKAFKANGIIFSGISSLDTKEGDDTVVGLAGESWSLTDTNKKVLSSLITFSNIEVVQADNSQLIGTDANSEAFTIGVSADNKIQVGVNSVAFTGINSIAAGEGSGDTDTITSTLTDDTIEDHNWTLVGTNQVNHAGIVISNAETFRGGGGTLTGDSSSDDVYTIVDDTGTINVDNMYFYNLNRIETAQNNSDKLIGTSGVDEFSFNGNGELEVHGLTFKNIETVDAGSDNGV
ncbi:hypothetical protein, partial [Microbulbifer epialgicus]